MAVVLHRCTPERPLVACFVTRASSDCYDRPAALVPHVIASGACLQMLSFPLLASEGIVFLRETIVKQVGYVVSLLAFRDEKLVQVKVSAGGSSGATATTMWTVHRPSPAESPTSVVLFATAMIWVGLLLAMATWVGRTFGTVDRLHAASTSWQVKVRQLVDAAAAGRVPLCLCASVPLCLCASVRVCVCVVLCWPACKFEVVAAIATAPPTARVAIVDGAAHSSGHVHLASVPMPRRGAHGSHFVRQRATHCAEDRGGMHPVCVCVGRSSG